MICRSSEMDVSPLVGKFYGSFNNVLRVMGQCVLVRKTKPLMFHCYCLPLSYTVHQRRLIYWKNPICSDNVVLQILARRCRNDVRALCDIY